MGVLSQAVEGLGYVKGCDSASAHRIKYEHPTDGTISLRLDKRSGRPSVSLPKKASPLVFTSARPGVRSGSVEPPRKLRTHAPSERRPTDDSMHTSLPLLLLTACLTAGCTGGDTTTNPPPAGVTMSITDPWKSMNLPIDGAVVELSNEVSLKLSYPTHTQETASSVVAVLTDGLVAAGFAVDSDKDAASARKVKLTKPDGPTISLTLDKRAERPSVKLTAR